MLENGHRLKVSETSIVGFVTAQRKTRLALDVSMDTAFLKNPNLPETRSELALPLIIGDQLLGALDIQSRKDAAFDDDSILVLQVLANQVAIAINNAMLFTQSQNALETTQRAYGEISRQAWREFLSMQPDINYIGICVPGDIGQGLLNDAENCGFDRGIEAFVQ